MRRAALLPALLLATLAFAQNAAQLDRLVDERAYPELARELPQAKLTPLERDYFQGILDDREHRPAQALRLLEKVLPELRKSNPRRAALALRTLANDYFELGRYGDSADAYADLLAHFAGELPSSDAQGLQNNLHTFELLRSAPPQTVANVHPSTAALRHDKIGDIDVALAVGAHQEWWIFDTGANVTTISESTAKRLGLKLSEKAAATQSGATGQDVPLHTAVIPELRVGDTVVRNVAAMVMTDKALDIDLGDNGHYAIPGILGYPVLSAIGSFRISGDQLTIAPPSGDPARCTPMYVEELVPLIVGRVNRRELLFSFDTGASTGSLTAKYFREFPAQFATKKAQDTTAGGAGGLRAMKTYDLDPLVVGLGDADATLHHVTVLTQDLGTGVLDQVYGNLGQSLVSPFQSYVIDFTHMRLCVGPERR